jgi:hypothetical protein
MEAFGGQWYPSRTYDPKHSAKWEWSVSTKRSKLDIGRISQGLSGKRHEQLRAYGFTIPETEPYTEDERWAWLAGFMDAEGHVTGTGGSLSTNLILVQVATDEPLRWAQGIIGGGKINWHKNKWNGSYRYGVYGSTADKAIDRLMPMLCSYRSTQIQEHYARQRAKRAR